MRVAQCLPVSFDLVGSGILPKPEVFFSLGDLHMPKQLPPPPIINQLQIIKALANTYLVPTFARP
jgi:hypothetical protein